MALTKGCSTGNSAVSGSSALRAEHRQMELPQERFAAAYSPSSERLQLSMSDAPELHMAKQTNIQSAVFYRGKSPHLGPSWFLKAAEWQLQRTQVSTGKPEHISPPWMSSQASHFSIAIHICFCTFSGKIRGRWSLLNDTQLNTRSCDQWLLPFWIKRTTDKLAILTSSTKPVLTVFEVSVYCFVRFLTAWRKISQIYAKNQRFMWGFTLLPLRNRISHRDLAKSSLKINSGEAKGLWSVLS